MACPSQHGGSPAFARRAGSEVSRAVMQDATMLTQSGGFRIGQRASLASSFLVIVILVCSVSCMSADMGNVADAGGRSESISRHRASLAFNEQTTSASTRHSRRRKGLLALNHVAHHKKHHKKHHVRKPKVLKAAPNAKRTWGSGTADEDDTKSTHNSDTPDSTSSEDADDSSDSTSSLEGDNDDNAPKSSVHEGQTATAVAASGADSPSGDDDVAKHREKDTGAPKSTYKSVLPDSTSSRDTDKSSDSTSDTDDSSDSTSRPEDGGEDEDPQRFVHEGDTAEAVEASETDSPTGHDDDAERKDKDAEALSASAADAKAARKAREAQRKQSLERAERKRLDAEDREDDAEQKAWQLAEEADRRAEAAEAGLEKRRTLSALPQAKSNSRRGATKPVMRTEGMGRGAALETEGHVESEETRGDQGGESDSSEDQEGGPAPSWTSAGGVRPEGAHQQLHGGWRISKTAFWFLRLIVSAYVLMLVVYIVRRRPELVVDVKTYIARHTVGLSQKLGAFGVQGLPFANANKDSRGNDRNAMRIASEGCDLHDSGLKKRIGRARAELEAAAAVAIQSKFRGTRRHVTRATNLVVRPRLTALVVEDVEAHGLPTASTFGSCDPMLEFRLCRGRDPSAPRGAGVASIPIAYASTEPKENDANPRWKQTLYLHGVMHASDLFLQVVLWDCGLAGNRPVGHASARLRDVVGRGGLAAQRRVHKFSVFQSCLGDANMALNGVTVTAAIGRCSLRSWRIRISRASGLSAARFVGGGMGSTLEVRVLRQDPRATEAAAGQGTDVVWAERVRSAVADALGPRFDAELAVDIPVESNWFFQFVFSAGGAGAGETGASHQTVVALRDVVDEIISAPAAREGAERSKEMALRLQRCGEADWEPDADEALISLRIGFKPALASE